MKQVIIYILSFLGILSQMSCDDQLNALPTQSKVVGNVIVDQKSAEVALNGVYYRFAEGGDDRGTPSTQWGYSQEIVPAYLSGYITRTSGVKEDSEFLLLRALCELASGRRATATEMAQKPITSNRKALARTQPCG